jgi:plastocyanin
MTELVSKMVSGARGGRRRALALPLLALAVACGVGLSVRAAARPEPRTITLVARGMAFYVPGQTAPNPRLVVGRGEELRFVLRNEDPGMAHDFAALGKATKLLKDAGEAAELTLRAPATAGEHDYLCSLHPRMMRGLLEVR